MNSNTSAQLTLEQEFKLKLLSEQSRSLDLQQAQDYVIELSRQIMLKDNLFKLLLKDAPLPPPQL